MYDWHDGGGWGPGTWIAMGFMMLVFWSIVAVVVVYVVRNLGHRHDHIGGAAGTPPDSAMRILDERFARGEIDAEEYNHRRDLLRSQ